MTNRVSLLPFDKVEIDLDNGSAVPYSAQRYMEIPLKERVTMLLRRRVRFYLNGQMLDTRATLSKLGERA